MENRSTGRIARLTSAQIGPPKTVPLDVSLAAKDSAAKGVGTRFHAKQRAISLRSKTVFRILLQIASESGRSAVTTPAEPGCHYALKLPCLVSKFFKFYCMRRTCY